MRKSYVIWLACLVMVLSIAACGGGGSNPPAATTGTTDTTATTGTTDTTGTTATTGTTPATPTATTNPAAPITPTPPSAPANPAVVVKTGIFVDAPVEGLSFVSGGETGVTDASGTFRFEAGGNVQFKVGNVVLGQAPAKALMTPLDLVKAVDAAATATDPRIIQITQFLMTVDSSATIAKMTIPALVATSALNETAVDLSKAPVDIAAILGRITTHTLVTPAAATAHLAGATTAFTPAQITGTFAAVDSAAAPKLGLNVTMKPNLAGDAFDVTGVAAHMQGATWTVAGTMTTGGVLTATGTGTGATPPANMTITGAMTAATQITGAASFSLNNVLQQVPVVFDKAAVPAVTGKFALASDPGVSIAAVQIQHMAAGMTILPDGRVSAHLVEGEVTGLPLAAVLGGRSVDFSGVVTTAGNIVAIGGTPGAGETTVSRSSTPPSTVALLTGSLNAIASTAAVKVAALDITGGGLSVPPLTFVVATNALTGVYVGTNNNVPPGTVAFGVNNDGSVHGYTRFPSPGKRFPESDDLIDGVVNAAGVLGIPPGFAIGNLGAIGIPPGTPGLVMTSDEGVNFGAFVGVFAGTIDPAGAVAGNWTTGPVLATGTFSVSLVP